MNYFCECADDKYLTSVPLELPVDFQHEVLRNGFVRIVLEESEQFDLSESCR